MHTPSDPRFMNTKKTLTKKLYNLAKQIKTSGSRSEVYKLKSFIFLRKIANSYMQTTWAR